MRKRVAVFILCLISFICLLCGCAGFIQTTLNSNDESGIYIDKAAKRINYENEQEIQLNKFCMDDIENFKAIQKFYPGFEYSEYYINSDQFALEMYFPEEDTLENEYFETEYVFYNKINNIVTYSYSAGKMDYGSITYTIVDKNTVVRVFKSSGTSAYRYQIDKNGAVIDEGFQMYDDEDTE